MTELRKFLACAQRQLRLPAGSVTVCLVTDATIARWNRTYRRKPGPTDVLSFPADNKRIEPPKQRHNGEALAFELSSAGSQDYFGDIAIAPSVARRNARRYGRTFDDELRSLILHGLLHLMGYDHETDTGQMNRRERYLRRMLGLA